MRDARRATRDARGAQEELRLERAGIFATAILSLRPLLRLFGVQSC
jgi:hypothetical protein